VKDDKGKFLFLEKRTDELLGLLISGVLVWPRFTFHRFIRFIHFLARAFSFSYGNKTKKHIYG